MHALLETFMPRDTHLVHPTFIHREMMSLIQNKTRDTNLSLILNMTRDTHLRLILHS